MKGIEVKQITKRYGKKVILNGIGFELEPNKIYGLLGRNGAGKSTLLNIMTDRVSADDGEIRLDGVDIQDNDQQLGNMYLMSEVDLYPKAAKVSQIFKWTAQLYNGFDMGLAMKLAQKFDLDVKAQFSKLSTGYRTIMKLVIALSVQVEFIFLDEPVLGLDANHRDLFYKELVQSYSDNPRTFVISTHLIEEVAQLIEHVLVIDQGRLIIDDETEEILKNAYMISGTEEEVDQYVDGLNVIGSDKLASLKASYVFGELDNRVIPDRVSIDKMDLQTLFINLTNGGQNNE
ncbi:ABC transporter ATP-binding protein [Pediococcus argentinicus]|uniref:ABC transporter ATP-binding protein n=1 Tax=Pediococcus argentinicus TaxID=480391 RepID=UPI00339059EA